MRDLNYDYTFAAIEIPVTSGASITVESHQCWTSADGSSAQKKVQIKVKGSLKEKGERWEEEWVFELPSRGMDQIDNGFRMIKRYVQMNQNRIPRGELRREVYADIFDWLRVGWVEEKGGFKGYARFSKGDLTMDADFENVPALVALRDAIATAV